MGMFKLLHVRGEDLIYVNCMPLPPQSANLSCARNVIFTLRFMALSSTMRMDERVSTSPTLGPLRIAGLGI